jgi:hypothetical protein
MPAACASRTIPLELAAPSRRSSKEFLSSKKRQQNRYIHSSILSNYNCLWPSCSMSLGRSLKRVLFEAMKSLSLPARRYRSCFRPSEYRRSKRGFRVFPPKLVPSRARMTARGVSLLFLAGFSGVNPKSLNQGGGEREGPKRHRALMMSKEQARNT